MNEAARLWLERNEGINLELLIERLRELEQYNCDDCGCGPAISDVLRAAGVPESEYARKRRIENEKREAEEARRESAIRYVRQRHPSAITRFGTGVTDWVEIYDQMLEKVLFFSMKGTAKVWEKFATTLGWKYEEPKP